MPRNVPNPVTATDPMVDYLTTGNWNEPGGGAPHKFNVAPGGTLTANIGKLTDAGQSFAINALQMWTDVTGIKFKMVYNRAATADIYFDDSQAGAATWSDYTNGIINFSDINISTSWINPDTSGPGGTGTAYFDSYSMQSYVHEIGHALGLGHPGNYDGTATYATNAKYANDSWQATVMSYFSQVENPTVRGADGATVGDYAYVISPQMADILGVNNMYGTPTVSHAGATTYGYNSTAGGVWDQLTGFVNSVTFTLYDTSGVDTLDFSGVFGNQNIILHQGAVSDVMGAVGNMMIAYGTQIENAIGGLGNDLIKGNTARNVLHGGAGNDQLVGGFKKDFLFGDAGNDQLRGGRGNDTLDGGRGNDILRGGLGTDTLTGGGGSDEFIFRRSVDFSQATGSTDTITDFQKFTDNIKLNGDGLAYTVADLSIVNHGAGVYDATIDATHVIHVTMQSGVLDASDFIFV